MGLSFIDPMQDRQFVVLHAILYIQLVPVCLETHTIPEFFISSVFRNLDFRNFRITQFRKFLSSLCEEFCMSDNLCISFPPAAVPAY